MLLHGERMVLGVEAFIDRPYTRDKTTPVQFYKGQDQYPGNERNSIQYSPDTKPYFIKDKSKQQAKYYR